MKILFLTVLLLWCLIGSAQTANEITSATDVLPPPPNAAAIAKQAEINVNKNTGSPGVSIPLFAVKGNKLNVNLTLSYSSTGLKVDEIASRVGMGWVLNMGGVISRTVRHLPDEIRPRRGLPWAPFAMTWSTWNYITPVITANNVSGYDAEPDLFSFNFNGYSGSFILDDNMEVMQIAKSDIRILYNFDTTAAWNFKLITPDGVSYFFGGSSATEKTKRTSTCGKNFDAPVRGSWYLKKIAHPNGEEIVFEYAAFNYTYDTGLTQTMYWVNPIAITGFDCGTCSTAPTSTCVNTVLTNGVLLKSITAAGKSQVNVFYRDRNDCHDSLISKIELRDLVNNKVKSSYNFIYDQVEADDDFQDEYAYGNNISPYLAELKERSSDTLLDRSHTFTYLDPSGRAPRLSYAQDHWGYFNGIDNESLVPKPDKSLIRGGYFAMRHFPNAQGNREPDSNFVVKGLLSEIIYPTGGKESIVYEANRIFKPMNDNPDYLLVNSVTGTGLHTSQINDSTFTIDNGQEIEIAMNCIDNSGTGAFDSLHNKGFVYIFNSESAVGTYQIYPGASDYKYLELPNGTYTARVEANGSVNTLNISVKFKPVNTLVSRNVITGGARVKSITTSTAGNPDILKRYYYGSLDFLYESSMGDQPMPNYMNNSIVESASSCSEDIPFFGCETFYIYSNSINSIADYQSGVASYQSVIESNGNSFENGGTLNTFWTARDGAAEVELGYEFLAQTKTNFSSALNGKPIRETILKKTTGGSIVPLKETNYHYKVDSSGEKTVYGVLVNGRRGLHTEEFPALDTSNPAQVWTNRLLIVTLLKSLDIMRYKVLSDWVYVDSLTTTNYDENGSNPITDVTRYRYENTSHTQPTRIETKDSKGILISTVFTNPYDHVGVGVYDTMLARNIITAAITKKIYKVDTLLTTVSHNYDFFNSSQVEMVSIASAKRAGAAQTDLNIGAYDALGNILQYTAKDGVPHALLWDYASTNPVSHTVNASHGSVAASSFEADGKGNWDYTQGGCRSDSGSVTGNKAYTLATGYVERTALDSNRTYVITYWLKTNSGSASINSATGGNVLIEKNGWKLYQREITGSTTIQVSGTGVIDELRLYPKNAQMTTYTYDPLTGVTSQCDANNRTLFYEYDSFNRLLRIKDADKNILKTFEYKYQETQ